MNNKKGDSDRVLRGAWSKRARNEPLTTAEQDAIRDYDRRHDEECSRMRIPAELWEQIVKVSKARGTSPHLYVRSIIRADLENKLVPRERLTDLQAKFETEVRDALRVTDDANRRLSAALRDREAAVHERDEILELMEATANRFDDLLNVLGAPDAPEVDLDFLRPRIATKNNDPHGGGE